MTTPMTFGSLFAGIGGFDLGLERAGIIPAWQVEIDDYCNRVLAKHWPDVKRYRDVKKVHGTNSHAHEGGQSSRTINAMQGQGKLVQPEHTCPACLPPVDLICGGFPCQPHSYAGQRKGAADDRNLWPDTFRITEELRPRWVLFENVPGIRTTMLDQVLSDLESIGYSNNINAAGRPEIVPLIIPACAVDARHRRDRVWIVAYCENARSVRGQRVEGNGTEESRERGNRGGGGGQYVGGEVVADAISQPATGRNYGTEWRKRSKGQVGGNGWQRNAVENVGWLPEPPVGRVADGIPNRVDRLRGLGNAVVPQVVEFLGRLIIEADRNSR